MDATPAISPAISPAIAPHKNVALVLEAAAQHSVALEVRQFPDGTRTAADAAAAVGVNVGQIVKSLIFAVGESPADSDARIVLAMVSGAHNLDEHKLAVAASTRSAWRVDANAVRLATGFAVGGVAPFGHPTKLDSWIDKDLLAFDEVWAAAGTPEYVFSISPITLCTITNATISDLGKE
jgi:prolyl-tRNA editing enzyme YbaK/EbsC (Cys-tRNA(Pro) deacylase)